MVHSPKAKRHRGRFGTILLLFSEAQKTRVGGTHSSLYSRVYEPENSENTNLHVRRVGKVPREKKRKTDESETQHAAAQVRSKYTTQRQQQQLETTPVTRSRSVRDWRTRA